MLAKLAGTSDSARLVAVGGARETRAVIVLGLSVAGLVIVWLLVVRLLWDHSSG